MSYIDTVPIAIVAHPSRRRHAEALAEAVKAEAVLWDNEEEGCAATHLAAWKWLADSSSTSGWALVLEDDAIPLSGLRFQLQAALRAVPPKTDVLSLYLGRGRPPHWQPCIAKVISPWNADPNFLICQHLLHGVAYAVRSALIPDLVSHLAKPGNKVPLDEKISGWARWGHQVAYTRPSLVNHNDKLVPVIVARSDGQAREETRTAWFFDGRRDWVSTSATISLPKNMPNTCEFTPSPIIAEQKKGNRPRGN